MRLILILFLFPLSLFAQNVYFVATNGDDGNAGTIDAPWATWEKAIDEAYPGDTIFFRGGVYYPASTIRMGAAVFPAAGRSGTREAPIHYYNYPGEHPIFDFSEYEYFFGYPMGIDIQQRQYLYFRGFTIRNVWHDETPSNIPANGFSAATCANMRFVNITIHDIDGRAWWFASGAWDWYDGVGGQAEPVEPGPFAYDTTMWINCDAYNLYDWQTNSPGNAADGWKTVNYYRGLYYWYGCRVWNYSDDGFDPSGSGVRILENCWAMSTDKYSGLSEEWDIEGNGFKFGATHMAGWDEEPLHPMVYVINCIAADCVGVGFVNNLEGDGVQNNAQYYNNLAYKVWSGFFDRGGYYCDPRRTTYYNNIVYDPHGVDDYKQVMIYQPSAYPAANNTWLPTMEPEPYDWPGWIYNDDFWPLEDNDFISLDLSQLTLPRKSNGSLPKITFGRLDPVTAERMVGVGTYVGMSAIPDIGVDWAWVDSQIHRDIRQGKGVQNKSSIVVEGRRLIF